MLSSFGACSSGSMLIAAQAAMRSYDLSGPGVPGMMLVTLVEFPPPDFVFHPLFNFNGLFLVKVVLSSLLLRM